MTPPPGWVRLTCADPALDVTVRLGPEPAQVTAGLGGWAITARPGQVGMTTWEGVEPLQVSLSLMFDGYADHRTQERPLARLFAVARGDDESEPGRIEVEGVPIPAVADGWVIENLDYGEPILARTTMRRLRQPVTLTLREYVSPKFLTIRKGALKGSRGKTRVVTAKKGETPVKLARRVKCQWTDLRTLNPALVKKANQTLKTGTKLRAPAPIPPTRKPSRPAGGRSRSRTR